MTLFIKTTRPDEKTLVNREIYQKLNIGLTVLIALISCMRALTVNLISILPAYHIHEPIPSKETVMSLSDIDLGTVSGYVIGSNSLPVNRASVVVYKQMGLINSAVKNPGYSNSVLPNSNGSYIFASLPSGACNFEVRYPDHTIQTIDYYSVWPSSSSSYGNEANALLSE